MAKKDNINASIFCALKVSEKSKVPVLLIANPGMGKSTTVEMYAEARGYELILLRGNSESAESILGYQVSPGNIKPGDTQSAIHLRPDWFQEMLDNEAAGKKSLLFLDEITTANEFVQAALLHLIFERKVGKEDIPDDTLIVSAGNYASNLSNSMQMLPPLMNRFEIFNIQADIDDLDTFLSRYDGAIAGTMKDRKSEIFKEMKQLDSQEIDLTSLPSDFENKVGDYIERVVKMTAKQFIAGGQKKLNLNITEMNDIYSDLENDEPLRGFVTLRTLSYLVEVAKASYLNFGKAGLTSNNFRKMVDGLVGIGLTRNSQGEVAKNRLTDVWMKNFRDVVNDIEKMNNKTLPGYIDFLSKIIKDKKTLEVSDMNAIINKFKEIKSDQSISNIERPIDPAIIQKLCGVLKDSSSSATKIKVNRSEDLKKQLPKAKFHGIVSYWNYVVDTMNSIVNLVNDESRNYTEATKTYVESITDDLRKHQWKLRTVQKMYVLEDPALGSALPEIKNILGSDGEE